MQMTELLPRLGRNDLRLFRRDSFLIFMFVFIAIIALALRFGLPWLNQYFADAGILPNSTIKQSLADYYPLLIGFFGLFDGALLAGTIFGFMLLDEKDDETIKAMLVTPVPFHQYALYRVLMPFILSIFVVLIILLFIDLSPLPFWQLLLISTGAAFTAPICTLFYAITAENKVQGFAMSKFASIAGWLILIGWFVAEPWQWLFGLFPPFLVSKAYWMALNDSPGWWVALGMGILLQVLTIYILARGFRKIAYR